MYLSSGAAALQLSPYTPGSFKAAVRICIPARLRCARPAGGWTGGGPRRCCWWRCCWRRVPRSRRDSAEIQPRYSRGTAEVQPRCSRGAAEVQPRYSRGLAATRGEGGLRRGENRGVNRPHAQATSHALRVMSSRVRTPQERAVCGWTPLIFAARHGRAGCARLLLDARANLSARDTQGNL